MVLKQLTFHSSAKWRSEWLSGMDVYVKFVDSNPTWILIFSFSLFQRNIVTHALDANLLYKIALQSMYYFKVS